MENLKIGDKVRVANITDGDCNEQALNKEGEITTIDLPTENDPYLTIGVSFSPVGEIWLRPENLEFVEVGDPQPFEKHIELAAHIERMANTGRTGSGSEWCAFLSAINKALTP